MALSEAARERLREIFGINRDEQALADELANAIDLGGNVANTETITIGGRVIPIGDNTVLLNVDVNTNNDGFVHASTPVLNVTPFQVPTSKKLILKGIQQINGAASTMIVGYANNAVAKDALASTLISPVYLGGEPWDGVVDPFYFDVTIGNGVGVPVPYFEIPAGKYPFVSTGGNNDGGSLMLVGELVSA